MKVVPNPMTVGDFAPLLENNGIRINRDYQRGGGIWSSRAKSALIETMVLGYPMPALFLHQRYDNETRQPFRDLVDGQQRSEAISAFWDNKLRLSKTLQTDRLRGARLNDLDEDDYKSLVTYSLPIFLFSDATEVDVREAFRRINSHTSVLTAEEKRHSRYQGEMKWFILGLSKEVQSYLEKWGVFTNRQLTRMADLKLLSEVMYSALRGITTIKDNHLDDLYNKYDDENSLPDQDIWRKRIVDAFRIVDSWDLISNSEVAKHYHASLLLLAVLHGKWGVPGLESEVKGGLGLADDERIRAAISERIEALDSGDALVEQAESESADGGALEAASEAIADAEAPDNLSDDQEDEESSVDSKLLRHAAFVRSTLSGTNTEESRRARFLSYFEAVSAGQ